AAPGEIPPLVRGPDALFRVPGRRRRGAGAEGLGREACHREADRAGSGVSRIHLPLIGPPAPTRAPSTRRPAAWSLLLRGETRMANKVGSGRAGGPDAA